MDRIAFAFQVAPDQEADFLTTNEEFQDAFVDFAASRAELGLTRMEVWIQPSARGPVVIFVLEGQLESYFAHIRTTSGVDEWMREKIKKWAMSPEDAEAAYQYPQSAPAWLWSKDS